MKKKYQKPTVRVVELRRQGCLLLFSPGGAPPVYWSEDEDFE
jgi:hypothetical protein